MSCYMVKPNSKRRGHQWGAGSHETAKQPTFSMAVPVRLSRDFVSKTIQTLSMFIST